MLKREITYDDFNGEKQTDTYYFHLSKPEIIKLNVEHAGGLGAMINRIMESQNHKAIIAEMEKIVLLAYGEKSDDGKRFIKNDELREAFSQTAAYSVLFMELATDEDAAAKFITGILPPDMVAEIEKANAGTPDKPTAPPKPPAIG